jgi:hypothetical protein
MNRQPFNRSGFNRTTKSNTGISGISLLKMSGSAVPNRDISALATKSALNLNDSANATNVKAKTGLAAFVLRGTGNGLLKLDAGTGLAEMIMATSANLIVQGEAVINLRDDQSNTWLALAPGDELIINTDEMTITVNGQNGMRYFSMDSDFFKLLSGENKIVYSDRSGSRDVLVDIIWKDRWL